MLPSVTPGSYVNFLENMVSTTFLYLIMILQSSEAQELFL